MSSEHNSNQFLTQEYITKEKGLSKEQFTHTVLRIIKESNRKVVLALIPVKDDIILDGTVFFADARDVAFLYFDSEYERVILKLTDESKVTFSKYKEARNVLVEAVRKQPEESKRAKQATASCSYTSSLLADIPGITDRDQNIIRT